MAAALAALVTGEPRYVTVALAQLEALFDTARWPDWRDLSHKFPGRAELRTGMATTTPVRCVSRHTVSRC